MSTQLWEYEDDNIILFWGGILSNWYRSDMVVDDVKYNCVEQFMMHQKALLFNDHNTAAVIMSRKNPRNQKQLGRLVKNFNQSEWDYNCKAIVYTGLHAKFTQNENLLGLLMTTDDKVIAEASPYDKIWGIGLGPDHPDARDPAKWKGTNYLGELLMYIRQDLKD